LLRPAVPGKSSAFLVSRYIGMFLPAKTRGTSRSEAVGFAM